MNTGRIKSIEASRTKHLFLVLAFFVAIMALYCLVNSLVSYASTNYELAPGSTCDVSAYGNNSNIVINKAGNYTIKGSSSKVQVIVKSGDVNLYLDNVKLTPGSKANNAARASAIIIEDQGGEVKLISKSKSYNYLSAYLTAPALRKDGLSTKLTFETDDPGAPGKIEAYATGGSASAIGCLPYLIQAKGVTGNMTFNSGIIEAKSKTADAAGIGGSRGGNCYDITINGGDITATGSGGAGIGAGESGNCKRITINGGTVTAYGGENGAGIGSAMTRSGGGNCDGILINGGTIKAIGNWGGAGIGSGWGGDASNIKINGGKITAVGGEANASGIGAGGGNFIGSARNIEVNGGNISAQGGGSGAGIGIGKGSNDDTDISIRGGIVSAKGGPETGVGIGGGSNHLWYRCKVGISITGGTIDAVGTKKAPGIGSSDVDKKRCSISISGGSIKASSEKKEAIQGSAPINDAKEPVFKTVITLDSSTDWAPIKSSYTDRNNNHAYYTYGVKDVYARDAGSTGGKLYFYLPNEVTTRAVKTQEARETDYKGRVATDNTGNSKGVLYRDTKITLDKNNNDQDSENGSGELLNGDTSLRMVKKPTRAGYTLQRITFDKEGTAPSGEGTIFDPHFMIIKPYLSYDGVLYSTDKHEWIYNQDATFYAIWRANNYNIEFAPNVPAGTKSTIAGTAPSEMKDISYTAEATLSANSWSLKGYTFNGWNTKADGTGTSYADKATVSKLTTEKSVTLYAMWKPLEYVVRLEGNSADGGNMPAKTLTYDKTERLDKCTYFKNGKMFAGWRRSLALGGPVYSDGASVENLCSFDSEGNIIPWNIEAQWIDKADATVSVTLDNKALSGLTVQIKNENFNEQLLETEAGSGIYAASNTQARPIPQGTYDIYINGRNTEEKIVVDDIADVSYLDYFSVELSADENYSSESQWKIDEGQPEGAMVLVDGEERVKDNSRIKFTAGDINTGYKFSSWLSKKTEPGTGWDSKSNPTDAVIIGATELEATSEPIEYKVEFDSNKPTKTESTVEGVSPESLNNRYDSSYTIPKCDWKIKGYIFDGWNTKNDGSGKSYSEEESTTDNLSTKDGDVVKLYAQWKSVSYYVDFKSTRPFSGFALEGMTCTYDEEVSLFKNTMTVSNYHFVGWRTEESQKIDYDDQDVIKNLLSENEGRISLWAEWEHDTYKIKYDSNGGQGDMEEEEVWTDTSNNLTNCLFSRKNYAFKSWNTKADGSGKAYKDGEEVKDLTSAGKTVTLYAIWNKDKPKGGSKGGVNTGDESAGAWLSIIFGIFSIILLVAVKRAFCKSDWR